jgi:hypothetical protein
MSSSPMYVAGSPRVKHEVIAEAAASVTEREAARARAAAATASARSSSIGSKEELLVQDVRRCQSHCRKHISTYESVHASDAHKVRLCVLVAPQPD